MKAETSERSGPQGSQAERGARAPIPGVAFESCQTGAQRLPVLGGGQRLLGLEWLAASASGHSSP